jgi:Tol biopolymer transport system component/transcriptional regulator with XRE-family HTH domain
MEITIGSNGRNVDTTNGNVASHEETFGNNGGFALRQLVKFWNPGAGDLLRKTLEEKGLRVPALAKKVGVTPRTVHNWLRANEPNCPDVHNFHDLCVVLGLTQDEFRAAADVYSARTDVGSASDSQSSNATPEAGTTASESADLATHWGHAEASAEALRTGMVSPAVAVLGTAVDAERLEPARYSSVKALRSFVALIIVVSIAGWLIERTRANRLDTYDIPAEKGGMYDMPFGGDMSPDGTHVVFIARSTSSLRRMLFVYSVDDRTVRSVPATEGNYTSFFWSADGRSIFFITEADLMKVGVEGGIPQRVAYVGEALKGTANADDVVVLGSRRGLLRVSSAGTSELLTRLRANEVAHSLPFFLPDGERVLFTITKKAPDESLSRFAAVAALRTGAIELIGPLPSRVQYVSGYLLYVREQVLFARPFDLKTLRFAGEEQRLASPIWTDRLTGEAAFSASTSALLVMPPEEIPPLYYVSRQGTVRRRATDLRGIQYVAVAKTSEAIAVAARQEERDDVHLWLCPLDGRPSVRIISQEVRPSSPVFSPDDGVLYYADTRTSWANIQAVELRPGGGGARPVLQVPDQVAPRDISPDGRFLLFQRWHNRDGNVWYMPVDDPAKARPLIATPEDEGEARFSPDGKRVSYVASRGGEYGIFVTEFPPSSQLATRVSKGRGWRARWSADGSRIYFAREKSVFEADPATRTTRKLFDMPRAVGILEIARDGGFFIREVAIDPKQTIVAPWRALAGKPLNLARSE